MGTPRSLAAFGRRQEKILPTLEEKSLTDLIQDLQIASQLHTFLNEWQIFALAYGDEKQGMEQHRRALESGGDDPCVRAYCIKKLQACAAKILQEGSQQKLKTSPAQ